MTAIDFGIVELEAAEAPELTFGDWMALLGTGATLVTFAVT